MCQSLGGDVYECSGACNTNGTVWGSGLYTSDSDVYRAAKHMGIVPCRFRKITVPGCGAYIGTTMNGITTNNYGNYGSSYFLIKVEYQVPTKLNSQELKKDLREVLQEGIKVESTEQLRRDWKEILREQMKEQNKTILKYLNKDHLICSICLQNQRSRVVLPCSHFHYCEKCVAAVRQKGQCAICKSSVTGDIKVIPCLGFMQSTPPAFFLKSQSCYTTSQELFSIVYPHALFSFSFPLSYLFANLSFVCCGGCEGVIEGCWLS